MPGPRRCMWEAESPRKTHDQTGAQELGHEERSDGLFKRIPRIAYTRGSTRGRSKIMKLRKRDKIVVLFWVPFWTLTAAFVAGVGWMVGLVHLP